MSRTSQHALPPPLSARRRRLLGLPLLDAMLPAFARADAASCAAAPFLRHLQQPGRAAGQVFPGGGSGRTRLHALALSGASERLRNDFTVFSGVSHPDVDGGHPADNCFLTAAPHPGSGGFRNTISLDQYIAERIGHLTRFPSLTLGVNVQRGLAQPLLDRGRRADSVRRKAVGSLQAACSWAARRKRCRRRRGGWRSGRASWTPSRTRRSSLQRNVGAQDRERLDQYFTSVRDLEQRLVQSARVGDEAAARS